MPRKSLITREVILEAAFEIAKQEEFGALSARNVAKKTNSSTRPIYDVFGDMDSLKRELVQKAKAYLNQIVSSYIESKNIYLNHALGSVYAAHKEPALFKSFYFDNVMDSAQQGAVVDRRYIELLRQQPELSAMSDQALEQMITDSSIYIVGLCSLVASGLLIYEQEKIKAMVTSVLIGVYRDCEKRVNAEN